MKSPIFLALLVASGSAMSKTNICSLDNTVARTIGWEDESGAARITGSNGRIMPAVLTSQRLHVPPDGLKVNLVAQLSEPYYGADVIEVVSFPVADQRMVGMVTYKLVRGVRHLDTVHAPVKANCVSQ